jgi:hypothetical protein
MPKDASKNIDRYKIRGGHLNEYDFQKEKAAEKMQDLTNLKSQNPMEQMPAAQEFGAQKATGKSASVKKSATKNAAL